jgi:demethylmenaquinone methyltransferase / 2-methoxy-6-polyprenyl-1,4-benzoquinol methylase
VNAASSIPATGLVNSAIPADKRRYVREVFSDIAPRYDFLNSLLSLSIDRYWRRAAVARLDWQRQPAGRYLDACAGTLELASTLARRPGFRGKIVATDFALPMLRLGKAKPPAGAASAAAADTLSLPFKDDTFDGAIVGFGIRNVADVGAGIAELRRVLQPGARLVILDFTTPTFAPMRAAYLAYFRYVLPVVGRLISGHPTAYSYLPSSVAVFQKPEELRGLMTGTGFTGCDYRLLTGGIAAIHWGTK